MRMGSLPSGRTAVVCGAVLALLVGCAGGDVGGGDGELSDGPAPDWDQLNRQHMEQLAEEFEVVNGRPAPTDVEFVRFIEPAEFGRVTAECVRDQGFEAKETFDNGISFGDVPEEQGLALNEAVYRCNVAYPVHPQYREPVTEQQIRVTYDYYVDVLSRCLTREGYQVPPAPSWETFLADYGTDRMWYPYQVVEPPYDRPADYQAAGYDNERDWWRSINETCPQSPPPEELHGDGG